MTHKRNRIVYTRTNEIIERGAQPYTVEEFDKKSKEIDEEEGDVVIIDTRHPINFSKVHIPGSIYAGIKAGPLENSVDMKTFSKWVGIQIDKIM